jgi:hypothetical protein
LVFNFYNMKKLYFLILLMTIVIKINAQTASDNPPKKATFNLSLGVGFSSMSLKNETVSPLIFSGTGALFHLTGRRDGALWKSYFQLLYQRPTLKSPFETPIEMVGGHLLQGYLRQIKKGENLRFFVGSEVQFQGVAYEMPTSLNSNFRTFLSSLNLTGQMEYTLKKHRIEAQIGLTALGFNARPDNNFSVRASDDTFISWAASGKLETLPNYLNSTWRLSFYPLSISKRFGWRLDYVGNYYGFKQQQFFGVVQHQVSTSLNYQF